MALLPSTYPPGRSIHGDRISARRLDSRDSFIRGSRLDRPLRLLIFTGKFAFCLEPMILRISGAVSLFPKLIRSARIYRQTWALGAFWRLIAAQSPQWAQMCFLAGGTKTSSIRSIEGLPKGATAPPLIRKRAPRNIIARLRRVP